MTAAAPTWGEIGEFLNIDGWRQLPSAGHSSHVFFEKVLDDGRVLQTHVSHSRDKRPSPGRFSVILREQIEISREQFWTALRSGEAVNRPTATEAEHPVEHEAWVVAVLAGQLHMGADEIEALDRDTARQLVYDFWARLRD